ncbi:MAG: glycosyltransferase [Alphaproteobacteria bacterium]|nr:glycosyltransferase [Alphaproteobacteria bacterium]
MTPVSLDADSRAFRIACSLADAGLRSLVIEGRPSASRFWGAEIEVRSPGNPGAAPSVASGGGGSVRRVVNAMRGGRFGGAGELALYAGFRSFDWWRHCHQPNRRLPPAELYYLHSFELHRAVASMAARLGAPVIYDAHDFYRGIEPVERQRSFDRNRMRPFLNRLEDRLVADAAAVVTVSNGIADLMEGAFGRRPVVIRNCHDERRDQAVIPDLRTALGLTSEHSLCVVVGNRKPGMAIAVAVDAIALLPERFHLAFVGRGYAAQAQRLLQHPLAARVHFGHFTEPDKIVPFIRSADLGLVIYEPYSANYHRALPNGFFQIVAAGLPLVRAPLPEIEAAIAGNTVGICLERCDPPTLARAILRCTEHQKMLHRNSAALAHKLRWELESARLQRLIEDVLGRPVATPAVPLTAIAEA